METERRRPGFKRELSVCVCLGLVIAAIYGRVCGFDFVNYDDNLYITDNPHTKAGLTVDGIRWAFTTSHASNWHPVTWLSHMLDVQLFGEHPGAHHGVNVVLHALNSMLVYLVMRGMTGAVWRSAFVAAFFAVHPVHVESVAWISERKDVLSALFWLLTTAAYVRYVRCPGWSRYAWVLGLFALGLMAKPMLVTLPFVLLLLDMWPLGRIRMASLLPRKDAVADWASRILEARSPRPWEPVLDKLPLLALAGGSCVATFVAQRSGHSMAAIDVLPLWLRVDNAIVAYARYLVMTVWPAGLAVFYPHPGPALPASQVMVSLLILLAISGAAAFWRRQRPYLLVGWLWYLGALVPVIGIVQVGAQALADRYTYVPLIGLFIAISWGVSELADKLRLPRWSAAVGGTAILAALTVCAFFQVSYWRNSVTLMAHALDVTTGNYLAHKNLGVALAAQKRYQEAVVQYAAGIRIKGNDPDLYYNLGNALGDLGKTDEAITQYLKALAIRPDHAETRYNLGNAYAKQGRFNEAMTQYAEVLNLQPDHLGAHINLGNALALSKRPEEAMQHYQEALRIDPNNVESLTNLGNVFADQKEYDEAAHFYAKAIRLDPNNADAYGNLGYALINLGRRQEAADAFSQVLRIDPGNARARENIRLLTGRSGQDMQDSALSRK